MARKVKNAEETVTAPVSKKSTGKSLVIVESPAKARTILKYLGKRFNVMASVGHVKDLPKSTLGIDLEHDFAPEYVTIKGKGKVLSDIKAAAREAESVYLAPDPDREGEAIAWHIAEEIKSRPVFRVLFNEITERGIRQAMQSPTVVDLRKVNAQQARRVLDRIVGYKISPLLWEKVRYGLSAGRVQSVAVLLICTREAEVRAFVPTEYWSIHARLSTAEGASFAAQLMQREGVALGIQNEAQALEIVAALQRLPYQVSKIEKKERLQRPQAPFITSRLQQDAVRTLRFTPKKTMMLAQQLYEGVETRAEGAVGLITYMRTDSVRLSPDFQREAMDWIRQTYGGEYVPETPNFYKSKKGAQEGHEAIRPTAMHRPPERLRGDLTEDQYRLYKLIWDRFVASQMTPARFDVTRVSIAAGPFLLRTAGSVLRFPGFTAVYAGAGNGNQEDEAEEGADRLPEMSVGQLLALLRLDPKQHFTQPPPRYNEALLIHDLEEQGIGRPSTYATIISTIQEREYVEKREGHFYPTELGKIVNDLLVENFPEVVNVAFTARMEENLDEIEAGRKEWVETVRDFYTPFRLHFDQARERMRDLKREEKATDLVCEKCAKAMVIKWGRFGSYLACSGYPECKNTKEFVETPEGLRIVPKETATDQICERCGQGMVIRNGRFGRFMACGGYPECKNTKPIALGVACPDCGGQLTEKKSRNGKTFYSCTNYPTCKFALWDRPLPRPCPACNAPFLLEQRGRGGQVKILCRTEGCDYRTSA